MNKLINTISKPFRDKTGKVVLAQRPNAPIIGWLICMVLGHVFTSGSLHQAVGIIGFGFLFAWSWLELTSGVNLFRRALGLVIIVLSVNSRL